MKTLLSIQISIVKFFLYILTSISNLIIKRNKVTYNDTKEEEYVPYTEMENNDGELIKIGSRVIVRSNEPDPLMIGTVIEFYDNEGKWRTKGVNPWGHSIVNVEDEATGKIFGCMGVIRLYNEQLLEELKDLKPIEQWNYLVHPYAQLKGKYGTEYKTFPERNLFKNIGTDEDGNVIGNCRTCGMNGVLINEHKCKY